MPKHIFVKYILVMFSVNLIGCGDKSAKASLSAMTKEACYKRELQYTGNKGDNIEGYWMPSPQMSFYDNNAYALHPLKQGYQQQYEVDQGGSDHLKTYHF